ncbi:hypothetical protein M422DRAFT_268549 [Sphaerobolus stellatus SS14]|uniref:DDE-1 domain-containing protein n=1 Tax=Sphaerobolus stellatus (strain SS14) TaxID=990650 RepID=A0A0C9UY20_SPHS4|nr:hypothetical protein M422DRAFT_268549 [Sphaerobolus stellatus SS14]
MQHVNLVILPSMGYSGKHTNISKPTATWWLNKLGYYSKEVKKGIYIDGHEHPDVTQARKCYISRIAELHPFMPIVNNETLEVSYLVLPPGKRIIIAIYHDEMSVATNEQRHCVWLAEEQQILRKKGNGRSIHVSDFILETSRRLFLTKEQITEMHCTLPHEKQLTVTDAHVIIHPGKNGDPWWDNAQLMKQIECAIPIFEFLHPGAVGMWIFDCSSAHEAFSEDALNVKNMNINPGDKQQCPQPSKIPLNNLPPIPGERDTQGTIQLMVYGSDHENPDLRGKAKGIKAVLQERSSVWRKLVQAVGGNEKKVVGLCKICKASQIEKDRLLRIASQDQAEGDIIGDDGSFNPSDSGSDTCCMTRALSQQQDFLDEKPLIERYIEEKGHICLFLPKFHCELDPIEMYWGWTRHQYRTVSDQKFSTAKAIIPQILNFVDVKLIQKFFRKTWRYIDAYEKGLDAHQAAFAVKVYKSHR